MSDSQFEDITSQIYASKIKNELRTSKIQITKLADERQEMRLKISELKNIVEHSQKQIDSKNSILKRISTDQLRMSKKLLILEQEKIELKQQMLKTEKHYQQVVNQLMRQKDELLKINKQLSENLIKIDVKKQKEDCMQCSQKQQHLTKIEQENQILIKQLEQKDNQVNLLKQQYENRCIQLQSMLSQCQKKLSFQQKQLSNKDGIKIQLSKAKQEIIQNQLLINQQSHKLYQLHNLHSHLEQQHKKTLNQLKNVKQANQILEKQLKIQHQVSTLKYEALLRDCQTIKQDNTLLREQIKLLRDDNEQKSSIIKRLQTKLGNQKQTQQMILNQYQQQIDALKQTLINLKQSQLQSQIKQMPIAQILFLISKYVKINKQSSIGIMKQCNMTQEERKNMEKDNLNQLLNKIYHMFPQQFGFDKFVQ